MDNKQEQELIGLIKNGLVTRYIAKTRYGITSDDYTRLRKIAIEPKKRRRVQERNTVPYDVKREANSSHVTRHKDTIDNTAIGAAIEFIEVTREHCYKARKYSGIVCQKNSWCLFVRGKSGRIKSIKLGDLVAGDIKVLGVSG